jgi:3-oxosteroid 1-dehydrogenase
VLGDGRVVGVADADGVPLARARRGVVLATGGFEWSGDLCGRFLRAPVTGAMSPRTNVGDGLRFAAA